MVTAPGSFWHLSALQDTTATKPFNYSWENATSEKWCSLPLEPTSLALSAPQANTLMSGLGTSSLFYMDLSSLPHTLIPLDLQLSV